MRRRGKRRVVSCSGIWEGVSGTRFLLAVLRVERAAMRFYSMRLRLAVCEESVGDVWSGRVIEGGSGCRGVHSYGSCVGQSCAQ